MQLYQYQNMISEMIEMLKGFNEKDVTEFPAFKVRLHYRNKLIELGLTEDLANSAAAAMNIAIPPEFNKHDDIMDGLFMVADEIAILAVKFYAASKVFGSDEIFLKLLDGTDLKIE